jgi:hypothetical protein
MQINYNAQGKIWVVNSDLKDGPEYFRKMYETKCTSVNKWPRCKVDAIKQVAVGDGMIIYSSTSSKGKFLGGKGCEVCGIAQETYHETFENGDLIHPHWHIPLGETWHKIMKPMSFDEMNGRNLMNGLIRTAINSSIFELTAFDFAAAHKVLSALLKR